MLSQFGSRRFDLLVIGGGITGAGVAREAALRGLSVALVERGDFASGTSSRSSRLIHGGLRYLKQLEFRLVRESVRERMLLLKMAPHLVKTRTFLFPVYRGDPDPLWKVRAGLTLYDLFAGQGNPVPHRILGREALLESEPALPHQGLTGGGLYLDCTTDDGRLTLEVIQSAAGHGAKVANYVEVTGFLNEGGRIAGATLRDRLTGAEGEVRADRVLAAAGPWADRLRLLDDPAAPPLLRLTKGAHITLPAERLPLSHPTVLRGPDGRVMFAVPARGFVYVGTTDTDHDGDPEGVAADAADVAYILGTLRSRLPNHPVGPDDVISTWAGVRPLLRPKPGQSPSETTRDYALCRSPSGLVTVGGGKLTAFRAMASHIVDDLLPRSRGRSHLDLSSAPLPGAPPGPAGPDAGQIARLSAATGLKPDWIGALAEPYGLAFERVAAEAEALAALPDSPPSPDQLWLLACARHAVRHEYARRVEDVLARRTGALLFSRGNGLEQISALAAEMGALLNWTPARQAREIEEARAAVSRLFAWRDTA